MLTSRLEHQSAQKLHPEEQQIKQEDNREGEWKQRGGRRRCNWRKQEGWGRRRERSGRTDIKGERFSIIARNVTLISKYCTYL